jgi:hypothetical protein
MQFEIASKTLVVTLAKISDFIRHNTGDSVALPVNPDNPDAVIELDDMRKVHTSLIAAFVADMLLILYLKVNLAVSNSRTPIWPADLSKTFERMPA